MTGRTSIERFFRVVLVVFLVVIVIAEILIYAPPAQARISSSLNVDEASNGTFVGSYDVSSTFEAHVNVSLTVSNSVQRSWPIYLYYDSAYPSSWSSPVWSFGLMPHLDAVLAARGLPADVILLDATQLAGFLRSPSTSDSVLVMPTGVIPNTVYNGSMNLLSPWVRAGGTLVWFGDTIGYYSGQPNTPLTYPSPLNPGDPGVSQFVNPSIFGSGSPLYLNASAASQAYNFAYDFGIVGQGLSLRVIQQLGGEVLGGIDGDYTNAARIPLGAGTIDYFAIPLEHEITPLSTSLVNMLQSGVLTGPYQPVGLSSVFVAAGTSSSGAVYAQLPALPWINASTHVCALLYQSDLLAVYGNLVCASANAS